jgi:hypothetical protein
MLGQIGDGEPKTRQARFSVGHVNEVKLYKKLKIK